MNKNNLTSIRSEKKAERRATGSRTHGRPSNKSLK